jgi:hypothetical protein
LEADVPARETSRMHHFVPSFGTGDFTLARTGNLALPTAGGVLASKSDCQLFQLQRFRFYIAALPRQPLNRNVKQRRRGSKFLLG